MTSTRWLDLDGAVNVRDVGGLPTEDGQQTRLGRLIRSDNLQDLTPADVRRLVDDVGVRVVVDLRTEVEVRAEGPGPMTREPKVRVHTLSLFPAAGDATDAAALGDASVLPWQERQFAEPDGRRRKGAVGVYLRYAADRPDSVVAALRVLADGPAVVHCAAGKDRTGLVVAFALLEVGVTRDAVVEDYALTGKRIDAILDRLRSSSTYRDDLARYPDVDKHRPRAETMRGVLEAMDDDFGGVPAWLRSQGWTDDDSTRLRIALLN